jgi:hypothetical protein
MPTCGHDVLEFTTAPYAVMAALVAAIHALRTGGSVGGERA